MTNDTERQATRVRTDSPLAAHCIAIVGMNGVGKSNLGKSLAARLHMKRIDTDTVFRETHGPEQEHIDRNGWDGFRSREEEVVCASMLPGHIVVLGGGAVESAAVRACLKERAIVLWLQAGKKRIHKHLTRAKVTRPEFRKGSSPAQVQMLLEQRIPFYEEVADVVLPPEVRFRDQVPHAIKTLEEEAKKRRE